MILLYLMFEFLAVPAMLFFGWRDSVADHVKVNFFGQAPDDREVEI
jgi:hypothetical protein